MYVMLHHRRVWHFVPSLQTLPIPQDHYACEWCGVDIERGDIHMLSSGLPFDSAHFCVTPTGPRVIEERTPANQAE